MIRGNFHTHTTYCDGKGTPRQMAERAHALHFQYLGFSGHVDIAPEMDIPAYLRDVRALQAEYAGRMEILCGGEFDFFFPEPDLEGFDYRIGSSHHVKSADGQPLPVDLSPQGFVRLMNEGFEGNVYRLCEQYYHQVSLLPDVINCTFIGHFDLITKFNDTLRLIDEDDPRYVDPAMAALDRLLDAGLPFEINTKRLDAGRLYPHRRFLKRIRERGGEILISSDAHGPGELTRGFEEAQALAIECGFDHVNCLTMKNGRPSLVPVKLQACR